MVGYPKRPRQPENDLTIRLLSFLLSHTNHLITTIEIVLSKMTSSRSLGRSLFLFAVTITATTNAFRSAPLARTAFRTVPIHPSRQLVPTPRYAIESASFRRCSGQRFPFGTSTTDSYNESNTDVRRWKSVLIPRHDLIVGDASQPPHDGMTTGDKVVFGASSIAAAAAFFWLVVASGPGAWRYYLSGGICAATSHAIPVPVDVVKTRKQVDPVLYRKSFVEATKAIVEQDGAGALLAGLGPTTWGYMLEGAVKFGVYEVLKPPVRKALISASSTTAAFAFLNSKLLAFATCAAVSGFAASIMLCPMEAVRIRMVAEPSFAPQGWIQCGLKMLKYEGVEGLWKGMTPMVYKQVPYTVTKNVSFDFLTRSTYAAMRQNGVVMSSAVKVSVPMFAAFVASLLSCVSSQPGDMLLSLVNAHKGKRRTKDIVRDILRTDRGIKGFFVGIKTRLLHVGIIVTLQLLIYDFVKRLCGIAATGL